jgi:hypothetical protein
MSMARAAIEPGGTFEAVALIEFDRTLTMEGSLSS